MNDIELIDYLLNTLTPGIDNCILVGTIEISINFIHIQEEGIPHEVFEVLFKDKRTFYINDGFFVINRRNTN